MIKVGEVVINPLAIVSAEVETRHYMNGSSSYLVVRMADGKTLRQEHGWGFNVFETLEKINEAV